MISTDVAIIGAGPYGLSAGAHLRSIRGLDVRVFGEPMSFWDRNMPAGMFLRSNWSATQIASPGQSLSLEKFEADTGRSGSKPVPLDFFVQYGRWYQNKAIPDLDSRKVTRIQNDADSFRLVLHDGDQIRAGRVIVACGIEPFARRPPQFGTVPSSMASHSSEHRDFKRFAGKRVLVVGAGQSALESAALLHESGAEVEVVARAGHIHWLNGTLSRTLHHRLGSVTSRLLYAPTDVGPAGLSQLMARPGLVRQLPRRLQNRLWRRCVRSAGARWLVGRLKEVPIRLRQHVIEVAASGSSVKYRLSGGVTGSADHILLGTGYAVDILKYAFIAPELKHAIQCVNGYPVLDRGFESSVPGLHFLGAPAVWSFGPLMQFVSGTGFASKELVRTIRGGIHKHS